MQHQGDQWLKQCIDQLEFDGINDKLALLIKFNDNAGNTTNTKDGIMSQVYTFNFFLIPIAMVNETKNMCNECTV